MYLYVLCTCMYASLQTVPEQQLLYAFLSNASHATVESPAPGAVHSLAASAMLSGMLTLHMVTGNALAG